MASPVVEQLAKHWGRRAETGDRRARREAIRSFESRYAVAFPQDMRDFLLYLDGTGPAWPNDRDAQGFSFWPLHRIRPVSDELAALHMQLIPELDRYYFAFADYLDWSWAYAIRLDAGDARTPIMLVGKEQPMLMADSFTDFVELYLRDSPRLYGRG